MYTGVRNANLNPSEHCEVFYSTVPAKCFTVPYKIEIDIYQSKYVSLLREAPFCLYQFQ